MNDKKYCIVGTGGFAKETLICLIDMLKAQGKELTKDRLVFLAENKIPDILGFNCITDSDFKPEVYQVVVAIGSPQIRQKVVEQLPKETQYTQIIHPSVRISQFVKIAPGAIITAGCTLTCDIQIGAHAHLNLHSTVGHDTLIGDFFTSAPGAHISGECHIKNSVYMGTNSAVRQGLTICSDTTIGMGSNVVKDITEAGIYTGTPAKKLK